MFALVSRDAPPRLYPTAQSSIPMFALVSRDPPPHSRFLSLGGSLGTSCSDSEPSPQVISDVVSVLTGPSRPIISDVMSVLTGPSPPVISDMVSVLTRPDPRSFWTWCPFCLGPAPGHFGRGVRFDRAQLHGHFGRSVRFDWTHPPVTLEVVSVLTGPSPQKPHEKLRSVRFDRGPGPI